MTNRTNSNPFVAVVGLHSSGSSCMAGVLYHLGLHMGNRLIGYWGDDPETNCGFEAVGLAQILREAMALPSTCMRVPEEHLYQRLSPFIREKIREAQAKQTIAGGKHPLLCRSGETLMRICGDDLRVVHIDRPLQDSINSLIRREGANTDPEKLEAHQRWLHDGKYDFVSRASHVLTVQYYDLLSDPEKEVQRVCEFLEINPDTHQVSKAIRYVKPEYQHVGPKAS